MENFLKEISSSHEPELTPDPQAKLWKTPQESSSTNSNSSSPLVRDLAESIPQGQDGIDITEFEASGDVFSKETTV